MEVKVRCPEDVLTLPWAGCWEDDVDLYALVQEYIQQEPDLHKRQLADVYASKCGMGQEPEIDPDYDPRQ